MSLCAQGVMDVRGKASRTWRYRCQGNSTLRQADPHNLIVAMLSDDDLAHLANYLRVGWGGQPGDVTVANVKAANVKALR